MMYFKRFLSVLAVLGCVGSSNVRAENITADTILHWGFDSPFEFGSKEYDSSGNNHDGEVVWDRIGSTGGLQWAPGRGVFGGAANMKEGVRGYIRTQGKLSLPEQWSLSLWIKPNVSKGRIDSLVCFNSDGTRVLNVSGHNKGGFTLSHLVGDTTHLYPFVFPTMKKDQWNNVVVVWGAKEITCYYQGEPKTLPLKSTWDPAVQLSMEFSGGIHQHRSYGLFDELRIYGSALSAEKVKELSQLSYYATEKRSPIADGGMGYTAWLKDGKARFTMAGGEMYTDQEKGSTAGKTVYLWEVVKKPAGAKPSFKDASDPLTTFSTDKAGAYKLRLKTSNYSGSDTALVNAAIFTPDRGPETTTFYEMPADRFDGLVIGSHSERIAKIAGKSIAPIAYWNFDAMPEASSVTMSEAASIVPEGKLGNGLAIRPEKRKSGVIDFGSFKALADEFTISFWATSERDTRRASFFQAKGENGKPYWAMDNSHNTSKIANRSTLMFGSLRYPIQLEGNWNHVVISYGPTGKMRKLWVNGWLAGTKAYEPLSNEATGVPQLIFNIPGDNYAFEGIIDEVALYDKMLNNEEVLQIYKNGVPSLTMRVPEDPYSTRAYPNSFVKKWFPEPTPQYQLQGFAEERFNGGDLPAYTHPRLNMTLEDLPRIRQALSKTRHGNNNRSFMYTYARTMFGHELENYGPNSTVSDKPPAGQNPFQLKNGTYPQHDVDWAATARIALALEALLTADTDMARILIDGMLESATLQQPHLDWFISRKISSWQETQFILGRRMTPILYDYLYNFMTTEERAIIRKVLATATAGSYSIGMFTMPAAQCNSSNWQPWITGDMVITLQSIYGENGFDPSTYKEAVRAVELCAEVMNDPESGVHREGMGKSSIAATQMSVLSMMQPKGKKIISSKALYNSVAKFHFHNSLPWDPRIVMYDQKNGGNSVMGSSSINVLHYAYPNDPILNFMKHVVDSGPEQYIQMRPRTFDQESWMISAIYVEDWKGPADLLAHQKEVAKEAGEPLGYFSDARGHMVSRSSWGADALQLYYVARVVTAGHQAPIRGYFQVNGLGRQWLTFRSRANHHSRANSLVTVDGEGQDNSAVRTLHYNGVAKEKTATFDIMGSDLTAAYRHANNPWPNLNYTRLKPDARPWFNMPFKYLVNWYFGDRPQHQILEPNEVAFDPKNYSGKKEFAYAYRTASFARGKHPYILIVDDVKKDDTLREYVWNGALPDDFKQNLGDHTLTANTAILVDPKDPSQRLFVHMFGNEGVGSFVIEHSQPTQDVDRPKANLSTEQMPYNLKFKNAAKTAKFRTLIYAHKEGDELPKITGGNGRYTITIGDQVDELRLGNSPGDKITLTRK